MNNYYNNFLSRQKFYSQSRKNDYDIAELILLCQNIVSSAQMALPFKSWTARMLECGVYTILKKISEEMAEFVIAINCDSSKGVTEESADLIYHILLLFSGLEISYDKLFKIISVRTGRIKVTSLAPLEEVALKIYNAIMLYRIVKLKAGRNAEGSIEIMIHNLYRSVASLTAMCLRIGKIGNVTTKTISCAVYEIIINIMVLLRYRNICYKQVANVIISRCYIKPSSLKRND
ncbi:MAG: phosphoribosyl-ATP diphosphatase [Candidatus Hodgkinia cicadicola]